MAARVSYRELCMCPRWTDRLCGCTPFSSRRPASSPVGSAWVDAVHVTLPGSHHATARGKGLRIRDPPLRRGPAPAARRIPGGLWRHPHARGEALPPPPGKPDGSTGPQIRPPARRGGSLQGSAAPHVSGTSGGRLAGRGAPSRRARRGPRPGGSAAPPPPRDPDMLNRAEIIGRLTGPGAPPHPHRQARRPAGDRHQFLPRSGR